MSTVLALDGITAGYGQFDAIVDVTLRVELGEVVAVVGANGAGKSTTMLVAAGLLRPRHGTVAVGGTRLRFRSNHEAARLGVGFVPERRELFPTLTVAQHLRLAARSRPLSYETFPELERLAARPAGLLSGGEQQMLAIARALALEPRVLVIDEMSMGLAPLIAQRILGRLRQQADSGIGVLLVEQHARLAIAAADRTYIVANGRVVASGSPADLGEASLLASSYLG